MESRTYRKGKSPAFNASRGRRCLMSGSSGKARARRTTTSADGRYSRRRVIVAATAVLGWQLLNARQNAAHCQENKMSNNTDTVRSLIQRFLNGHNPSLLHAEPASKNAPEEPLRHPVAFSYW